MKRVTLGYICSSSKLDKEDKLFIKLAKKKNIELEIFNVFKKLDEDEIEEKAKKCSLIFNNSTDFVAIELVKTLEELGKKVIENSKSFYYEEDKWMFFLKCKEHKIPTINTILLSDNFNAARRELRDFNSWPVIIKRVEGQEGKFVEKAENIDEAIGIIKKFYNKSKERFPIIAQEFVRSNAYRVTVIDGKIVQTALKSLHNWKSTGNYDWHMKKFKADKELEKIVNKITKVFKINIIGIDLLKKDDKWVILEINAEPAFDFFEEERELLVSEVLNFLKKRA